MYLSRSIEISVIYEWGLVERAVFDDARKHQELTHATNPFIEIILLETASSKVSLSYVPYNSCY